MSHDPLDSMTVIGQYGTLVIQGGKNAAQCLIYNIQTMRQVFSQEDFGGIWGFALSCLTLLHV